MLYASGFPIPAIALSTIPDKETTERFPCENCPCGCSTAAYCWSKCCCHTLAERIAWAKRNNVRPPEEVLLEASEQGIDLSCWGIFSRRMVNVVQAEVAPTVSSCCQKCCCANKKPKQTKSPQKEPNMVTIKFPKGISIWQSLTCQGLIKQWLTGTCGPLPEFVDWSPSWNYHIVRETGKPSYHFYGDPPQPPPPRSIARVIPLA